MHKPQSVGDSKEKLCVSVSRVFLDTDNLIFVDSYPHGHHRSQQKESIEKGVIATVTWSRCAKKQHEEWSIIPWQRHHQIIPSQPVTEADLDGIQYSPMSSNNISVLHINTPTPLDLA